MAGASAPLSRFANSLFSPSGGSDSAHRAERKGAL
jgi:hypothetical protein